MYIVTGGAGLIGSSLIWGLNQRGIEDILVVDHLAESEKWKNLRALKFADYMEREDFMAKIDRKESFGKIEGILHMGACSATTERNATYLIHNNFEISKRLALMAVENTIRFIYASSAATYGDGALGYDDNEDQLELLRPMNMYGYSKHLFDLWAKRQGLLKSLVGLKFTNVYGPNEHHKGGMRSMVYCAHEQILQTGKVRLFKSYKKEFADGGQMRDFIYVKDVVDMTLFLLLEAKQACGIFNIGSGVADNWNNLAKAVFAAMNQPVQIEYVEMPEQIRDRYQYYTKANMEKFLSTGYAKPVASLDEAVLDYIRNYKSLDRLLGDEP